MPLLIVDRQLKIMNVEWDLCFTLEIHLQNISIFILLILIQVAMNHKTHYETVSNAIQELRKQGYTVDFNLEDDAIICNEGKFGASDFEIADVYRYEGNTDPADEAAVYAIQSSSGLKGILVTGYGASSDSTSNEILEKLGNAHRE